MTQATAKKVQKFLNEYNKEVAETYGGDKTMALAEDASTYYTLDVKVSSRGITYATAYVGGSTYTEKESDDEEIAELIKWWRGCMRRARRYWAADSETLDKMSDGEIEDNDEDNE